MIELRQILDGVESLEMVMPEFQSLENEVEGRSNVSAFRLVGR